MHNEASWQVMDSLWDAVRKHPRRMRLLFSDRYYVEEYGAGHGFPYRAWHRVKIASRGSGESRRIVGEYVLTKDDIVGARKFEDAIAKGSFFVDIHNLTGPGMDKASGERLKKGEHYDIPYRCLVPKQIDNLLVAGRSISATHEAQGSIRVMFQCMAMGEAAGLAAAMCAKSGTIPRALDVQELRKRQQAP